MENLNSYVYEGREDNLMKLYEAEALVNLQKSKLDYEVAKKYTNIDQDNSTLHNRIRNLEEDLYKSNTELKAYKEEYGKGKYVKEAYYSSKDIYKVPLLPEREFVNKIVAESPLNKKTIKEIEIPGLDGTYKIVISKNK